MSGLGGCGGGGCGCAGSAAQPVNGSVLSGEPPAAPATINGIALHPAGQRPAEPELRELAWAELLRQEAVRQGRLPQRGGAEAPALQLEDRQAIETMLDGTVAVPRPTEEECRRYYDARREHYVEGRMVHLRHILFAVTSGVDVRALAERAEAVLLELSREGVDPARFAALARELSNCPSGAEGGDLGWIGPRDCAEELARELFGPANPLPATGLRPRLVRSRYGLHVVEVLGRKQGRQLGFDEVRERIAGQLGQQSRAKALHQYMQLLAGRAAIEGVSLEASASPLVQ